MRAIRQLAGETRDAVHASTEQIVSKLAEVQADVNGQLAGQAEALANLSEAVAGLTAHAKVTHGDGHERLVEILRFVLANGPEAQDRLRRLRETPEYELPFSESNPMVSVVIPTYDNHELLGTRALPSVLAQTYQNFEVVIVGDAAPDEAREVVERLDDPRVRFSNLPYRGPYPEDPEGRWRVAGVPPYNEAVRLARGLWIAPLGDDDAFRPEHLERVLAYARVERVELAYGRFCIHLHDGDDLHAGRFPPELGDFAFQSALYHRGLAEIFKLALADAWLGLPCDWGMCRRMMEAGVRMGMLDEETSDYYPSRVWTPRWEE